MPRRRSFESMQKDQQAADLYRRGLTYRQIAAQVGWKNQRSAFDAVRRAAMDASRDSLGGSEALSMLLERLQDYRRTAWRVASTKHYAVAPGGKLVRGPDGEPMVDDSPVLQALDKLLKCDQEEAKLRGSYAPVKTRTEVITRDMIEDQIMQLEAEIAERERAQRAASG